MKQYTIEIKDYDLIQNINILFEKPIIVVGYGHYGKKICKLLQDINLKINYIYDRKFENSIVSESEISIIALELLKEIIKKEEYLIIIGSNDYREELINELEKRDINGYICTWYAVQVAIELNIEKKYFSQEFRKYYLDKKNIIRETRISKYVIGGLYDLCDCSQAVLIYQPGKVGSSTIYNSLNNINVNCFHIHWIMEAVITERDIPKGINDIVKKCAKFFKEYLLVEEKRKIITLVRDPLGRALSLFFHRFWNEVVDVETDINIVENAQKFVIDKLQKDEEFVWFDKELKEITGVDIFEYPFDKEQGYTLIKKENVEILVLKMEQMNENTNIIGEFVGKSNLQLINTNIGSEKYYKYIYEEVKKHFYISEEILKEQYINNSRLDHFYTEKEKWNFFEKWKKS